MRFAVVLAVGLALASPLRALDPTCEPTSSPLLKLTSFIQVRSHPSLPPSESRTIRLLCKDRRLLSAFMSMEEADFTFTGSLTKGVATAPSFQFLRDRMAVAKIGFMKDCRFFAPLLTQIGMQVTWFGRSGRTNSFKVLSGDGVPCTTEELGLVLVLLDFHLETTQNETVSFP